MMRKLTLVVTVAALSFTECQCAKRDPANLAALDIAMMKAVTTGDAAKVKELLDQGARVGVRGLQGMTLLHIAAFQGRKEIIEILIANGAKINGEDNAGNRPLHMAAEQDRKDVVELLLGKGADVNAKNRSGITPLDHAIRLKRGDMAEFLRKHGGKSGREIK
ncbi:MAG: hypothetical protein GXP25_10740 [Planctomycetes bacterium]|nr:hypothetical protein [Planctomycetota bacterium]